MRLQVDDRVVNLMCRCNNYILKKINVLPPKKKIIKHCAQQVNATLTPAHARTVKHSAHAHDARIPAIGFCCGHLSLTVFLSLSHLSFSVRGPSSAVRIENFRSLPRLDAAHNVFPPLFGRSCSGRLLIASPRIGKYFFVERRPSGVGIARQYVDRKRRNEQVNNNKKI